MARPRPALVITGTAVLALGAGGYWLLERQLDQSHRLAVELPANAPRTVPSAIAALPPVSNPLDKSIGDRPEKIDRRTLEPALATERKLPGVEDGLVTVVSVTTKPFEIDRRYRSMEGPFAVYRIRLGADDGERCSRELWWWKGARIVVLDDNGKDLGPEFMCHLNVDVDVKARRAAFPGASHSRRLLTLTQGEMTFSLPPGRGVPVASDEVFSIMFQVLNHNREDLRISVRQRLELYFVRDTDLSNPVAPLAWHGAYIWVPVSEAGQRSAEFDRRECPCCTPLGQSTEATNNVHAGRAVDGAERAIVGHWVVPPGRNTWTYPLKRSVPKFRPHGERLFATWTHIHPFTKEVRLIAHEPGCKGKATVTTTKVTNKVTNKNDGQVGIERIDSLYAPEGIPLPRDASYELAVDYENPTDRPSDSMTSLGLFIDDLAWKRPEWADLRTQTTDERAPLDASSNGTDLASSDHPSCGLGPEETTADAPK